MIRWQDWTDVLLGGWLVASPNALDYWLNVPASQNAMGLGGALIIFNLISACRLIDKGQEIFNIVLGAWLVLSPFALGFEAARAAAMNAMAVGASVVVLALWQIHAAMKAAKK